MKPVHQCNCNHVQDTWDDDFLNLLAVASTALQIYNIRQGEESDRQGNYTIELIEKLFKRMDRLEVELRKIERLLERSVYNDRKNEW